MGLDYLYILVRAQEQKIAFQKEERLLKQSRVYYYNFKHDTSCIIMLNFQSTNFELMSGLI